MIARYQLHAVLKSYTQILLLHHLPLPHNTIVEASSAHIVLSAFLLTLRLMCFIIYCLMNETSSQGVFKENTQYTWGLLLFAHQVSTESWIASLSDEENGSIPYPNKPDFNIQ